MSPEERLKKIMEQIHISRQDISNTLGISLSSIAMYYTGCHKIRRVVALAIQTCYGVNADWIMHNKQPVFVKKGYLKMTDDTMKVAKTYNSLSKRSQETLKKIVHALHLLDEQNFKP